MQIDTEKYEFQVTFIAKAKGLEPIFFPEGACRFLKLSFWDLNCKGFTSGSEVMQMCLNPWKEIYESKRGSVEHRYRSYLLAVLIT